MSLTHTHEPFLNALKAQKSNAYLIANVFDNKLVACSKQSMCLSKQICLLNGFIHNMLSRENVYKIKWRVCVRYANWFPPLRIVVAPHNQAKATLLHYCARNLNWLFGMFRLRVSSSLDFDLHGRVFACEIRIQ